MSKPQRHEQILSVVRRRRIPSQETLRELLAERGIDVTQATLSRDIRELRLVKAPGADGASYYSIPDEVETTPSLRSLLPTLFLGVDGVSHMVVVRTVKGAAQTVAAAIDWEEWPEVLGTLGGDDTLLLVLRSPEQTAVIQRRLRAMADRSD